LFDTNLGEVKMTVKNASSNKVSINADVSGKIDENLLQEVVSEICPQHPFEQQVAGEQLENLISQYYAMSQAFPHLQAGSQKALYDHYVEKEGKIPVDVEITTAVGAFLCADETGVLYALRGGIAGLPDILNTRGFHANMLDDDIEKILGKKIAPDYSSQTRKYLDKLFAGLSSPNRIRRVATMVAFEAHAERMITGLWGIVTRLTGVAKDNLDYFRTHVGGDDPAETYHVQTTTEMIAKLVSAKERQKFIEAFKEAYSLNVEWCRLIAGN
jgi:hypothetical protein